MRTFACVITSDLQVFEEHADLSSEQGQAKCFSEDNESKHQCIRNLGNALPSSSTISPFS
jgi:hypothetical protein